SSIHSHFDECIAPDARSLQQLRSGCYTARMRLPGCVLLCTLPCIFAQPPAKRSLQLDDLYRLQEVSDPRCSPDGKWVAYAVATLDRQADKRYTSIWMVSWDGTQ